MNKLPPIGDITYVYALKDENEKIIYIGKSCSPKNRLGLHKQYLNLENISMEILDFFYDVESFWIKKYLDDGQPLKNKITDIKDIEKWEIGDIITINNSISYPIYDSEQNVIYDSIYSLSKKLNIDYGKLKTRLNNKQKYPEYKRYEYKR